MSSFSEIEGRIEETPRKGEHERQACSESDRDGKRGRKHKTRERIRTRMAR